jgi:hypothetical protein
VLAHDAVVFAAGTQTESVKCRPGAVRDREITTVTMASGRSEAATTRPRRQVGAAASAISHDSLEHGLGRGAASLVRGSRGRDG